MKAYARKAMAMILPKRVIEFDDLYCLAGPMT